jgi:hypothetical protein
LFAVAVAFYATSCLAQFDFRYLLVLTYIIVTSDLSVKGTVA